MGGGGGWQLEASRMCFSINGYMSRVHLSTVNNDARGASSDPASDSNMHTLAV